MAHLEEVTGRTFGDPDNGLLLPVRSGAPSLMPGMMDTVLSLGVTEGGPYLSDVSDRSREMYQKVVVRSEVTADDLDELTKTKVAGYKRPRGYQIWDELPKSGPGKIMRRTVRDRLRLQTEVTPR